MKRLSTATLNSLNEVLKHLHRRLLMLTRNKTKRKKERKKHVISKVRQGRLRRGRTKKKGERKDDRIIRKKKKK